MDASPDFEKGGEENGLYSSKGLEVIGVSTVALSAEEEEVGKKRQGCGRE